jgi:hypothetical protein
MSKPKSVRSYIENTLDPLFSKYIRLKYSSKGFCKCVTCGAFKHWKEMDCGHFVGRQFLQTRWDEKNVGPQCTRCNRHESGRGAQFALYLQERYGLGIVEELNRKSKRVRPVKIAELQELAKGIRTELKKLNELKG